MWEESSRWCSVVGEGLANPGVLKALMTHARLKPHERELSKTQNQNLFF